MEVKQKPVGKGQKTNRRRFVRKREGRRMKFSKHELTLLMDALAATLDKYENELAEQESILFDGIERGEDTEETEGYISLLDENIRIHQNLLDKLEALREGSYY